ncbi:hypothetical protein EDB89DRAFT_2079781 [Lactarius sanguifluus]|nr:hypothetical protein EDB89DRAFT_2079781 [Lactarius sanguifluus]
MPPRRPISRAPSGQLTTAGTPSTRTPPPSAASPSNPPSERGQPTPSVTGEVQPSCQYRFLKKRTPAPDMPPPPVPMPPPSLPEPQMAPILDESREAKGPEEAWVAAHPTRTPILHDEQIPETLGVVAVPIELQDTADPETAPIRDNSQATAASETALILGQSQESAGHEVVLVPNKSRETMAPEVSHVPGESQAAASPGPSRIPDESWETTDPEEAHIPGKSQDTAAPGLSRIPDESWETTASMAANVPRESRDTTTPDAAHVPDKPQVVEGSDGEDKMETESVLQDEEVISATSSNLLPRYTARVLYPNNLQSGRHFPEGFCRLLMLDPSDHTGDLMERCTFLMGLVLDLHADLSYIRDGLDKMKQAERRTK